MWQAQAECLLDRVQELGHGVGEALKRRKAANFLESRWRRERAAQFLGNITGRKVHRSGFFKLD